MQLSNPQWETYAEQRAGGVSKSEAARRANYGKGEGNAGHRVEKRPEVAARIEELKQASTKEESKEPSSKFISKPVVITEVVSIHRLAKKHKEYGIALQCQRTLAQIGGLLNDGSGRMAPNRVTTNITFNVNELNATLKAQFDEVSPSERQRLLEANPELAELMGVKIVDVASEPGGDEPGW